MATEHRDIERGAPLAGVRDEAPSGWAFVDQRQSAQNLGTVGTREHARIIRLQQVNGPRPVMAATSARDAIASIGVRRVEES